MMASIRDRWTYRTISDGWSGPVDNFLLLRFLAALAVIFGHSFALDGDPATREPFVHFLPRQHTALVGVYVFFVISGFLVAASFVNRNNIGFYVKSRILRIIPGLFGCLALSAFILGPLVTILEPKMYFGDYETYRYVLKNVSLVNVIYDLPGVFQDNRFQAMNGSLWTLPIEARMYVMLGLLGAAGVLARRYLFNVIYLAMVAAVILFPEWFHFIDDDGKYFKFGGLFFAGTFYYLNRDWIPLNAGVMLVLGFISYLMRDNALVIPVFCLFLSYATLWFAYVPRGFGAYNRFGDVSYGLYIYAFPVQQVLVHAFSPISPWVLFASASVVTLIVASLSWVLVEKPALRLKKVGFSDVINRVKRTANGRV